jgi:Tol biopolymer transport system component/DNA-binding winged helix-turn-helix (wHTH) protein
MAAPDSRRLQFGVFEIDLAGGELRKGGIKIKLQDQPLRVLSALLEHPGEIVTREHLREKIWQADTFVDFDQSLNKAINKIREALSDTAENPRFLETVPRRGYRFIAPVSGREPQASIGEPSAPVRARWRRVVILVGGAILSGAIIAWLQQPAPPRIVRSVQLTNDGRDKSDLMVTDGTRIYFTECETGQCFLAQVSTAGGEIHRLPVPFTSPMDIQVHDISQTQRELLVTTGRFGERDRALWVVPALGGSARRVGDLRASDVVWSPDQRHIVYARGNELYAARDDGTESRKLATFGGLTFRPCWSPDGTRLRVDVVTDSSAIWEIARDGTNLHRVLPAWQGDHWLGRWTPDGKYFIFLSKASWWAIPESTGLLRKRKRDPIELTFGPLEYLCPILSPDARKLYALGGTNRCELERYDVKSRSFLPYLSGISADGVDFSTDGRWVTYVTYPEGEVWRSKADGSQKLQLTSAPLKTYLPRWSPDGKQIAFMGQAPGKPWKIYLVPSEGGNVEQLVPGNGTEGDPNWSPDGSKLTFAPWPWADPATATGVYILDLNTRQISSLPGSQGLFSPRWSPDGNYIAALGSGLRLFDFKRSGWRKIGDGGFPTWSRDARYIYVSGAQGDGTPAVVRIDVRSRHLETVASLKGLRITGNYGGNGWVGLTPDGAPLVLREFGNQEIYAFEWEAP